MEDREDTMANWASLDKASILSSDKDFYKFTGDPTLLSRLYRDFSIENNKVFLIKQTPPKRKILKKEFR